MELIASPCSWSWVKVLTSITWCPICCRDIVWQAPFHSYGVRRHLVNRARNDVLHKNKEKLFSICPANYPRKSGTWPLQTTSHPLARRAGLVLVVAQGVVISLTEPCINDILENQKPLSLFSPNCVPPFRCSFRFLLKFSALKKFTTTGAGYGLLDNEQSGRRYNICVIIENCWRK